MANIILPNNIPDNRRKLEEWKSKRLKSGLHLPEYKHVALPEYWKLQKKPQTFQAVLKAAKPHQCIWQLENWDTNTGEVFERNLVKNTVTDNGAISMLKNAWNNAGSAVGIFNHVVVSPNGCSTTLTSATGTSAITTLSVAALPVAIANGATLTIGYGGGTTQTVTINNSGGYSAGATSLTVNSFTPSINYPIGTALVAIPSVTDNPSSVSGTVDSGALASGAFTYNATTGLGNRNVVIVATETGTSGNAGPYTEAYTANAGTIAANSTGSHVIFPAFTLGASSSETLTLTEKA